MPKVRRSALRPNTNERATECTECQLRAGGVLPSLKRSLKRCCRLAGNRRREIFPSECAAAGHALKVGSLSEKTERGRLRRGIRNLYLWGTAVRFWTLRGSACWTISKLNRREIKNCYPEFRAVRGECRFNGCIHVSEPGCAVKKGGENVISRGRYERYVHLVKEAEENKRNRF